MSSRIPKIIYQTWKTKTLDKKVQNIRKKIQILNPNYKMRLFDDNDIEIWIKSNFDNGIIYDTYKKLKVGAGKADFWRYLILYMNGGIYLDIDSDIVRPLDLLINNNDNAIISKQKYGDSDFVQWCLMFSPKHPILLRVINLCIYNINNKTTDYLPLLTGPTVFTNAVNDVIKNRYAIKNKINLIHIDENVLNKITTPDNFCKFCGKDYEPFCNYDNGCKDIILRNSVHWKNDKGVFNL